MKTAEELAEEYTKDWWGNLPEAEGMRKSARENYLAGYQAAAAEYQEKLNQIRLDRPAFKKHEIENLLSQANSDGFKRGYEQGKIVQSEWISVKDRLPEIEEVRNDYKRSKVVLWIDHDKDMMVGYQLTIGDRTRVMTRFSEPRIENFTHWMPLPNPPEATNER